MYTQNITVIHLRQYIDKIFLCSLEGVSGPQSAGRIRFLDLGAECMGVLIFFFHLFVKSFLSFMKSNKSIPLLEKWMVAKIK